MNARDIEQWESNVPFSQGEFSWTKCSKLAGYFLTRKSEAASQSSLEWFGSPNPKAWNHVIYCDILLSQNNENRLKPWERKIKRVSCGFKISKYLEQKCCLLSVCGSNTVQGLNLKCCLLNLKGSNHYAYGLWLKILNFECVPLKPKCWHWSF